MAIRKNLRLVPAVFAVCAAMTLTSPSCEVPPEPIVAAQVPDAESAPVVPAAQEPAGKPAAASAASAPKEPKEAAQPAAAAALNAQEPEKPAASKQEPVPQQPAPRDIAAHAFPPVMPDIVQHQDSWLMEDCLRCHETGVQDAPAIRHVDLPPVLLTAKCRTCHVFVPGQQPREKPAPETTFAPDAFPPMIPASPVHGSTWWRDDCMLCHETGIKGAPRVIHQGMPRVLLSSKCRTCHVQVRAVEADDGSVRR